MSIKIAATIARVDIDQNGNAVLIGSPVYPIEGGLPGAAPQMIEMEHDCQTMGCPNDGQLHVHVLARMPLGKVFRPFKPKLVDRLSQAQLGFLVESTYSALHDPASNARESARNALTLIRAGIGGGADQADELVGLAMNHWSYGGADGKPIWHVNIDAVFAAK